MMLVVKCSEAGRVTTAWQEVMVAYCVTCGLSVSEISTSPYKPYDYGCTSIFTFSETLTWVDGV